MSTLKFEIPGSNATITNREFGEISKLNLSMINYDYGYNGFVHNYDLLEIESAFEGEKPVEIRLMKSEAEKLRDYLNIVLPSMKGTK